jgi:hypothetical protein
LDKLGIPSYPIFKSSPFHGIKRFTAVFRNRSDTLKPTVGDRGDGNRSEERSVNVAVKRGIATWREVTGPIRVYFGSRKFSLKQCLQYISQISSKWLSLFAKRRQRDIFDGHDDLTVADLPIPRRIGINGRVLWVLTIHHSHFLINLLWIPPPIKFPSLECLCANEHIKSIVIEKMSKLELIEINTFPNLLWNLSPFLVRLSLRIAFFESESQSATNWKVGIPWNWLNWEDYSCIAWSLWWVVRLLLQVTLIGHIWISVEIVTNWKSIFLETALIEIIISASFEVLKTWCWPDWGSLWSVPFKSGSRLRKVGPEVFFQIPVSPINSTNRDE